MMLRIRYRRIFVLLAMLTTFFALPIVTACVASSDSPSTGHVTGVVAQRSGSVSLDPWPAGSWAKVTATLSTDKSCSYSVPTTDGSFAFDLPPGTYELTTTGFGMAAPVAVVVTAGTTSSVELFINIP